jgi:hypothetical protein
MQGNDPASPAPAPDTDTSTSKNGGNWLIVLVLQVHVWPQWRSRLQPTAPHHRCLPGGKATQLQFLPRKSSMDASARLGGALQGSYKMQIASAKTLPFSALSAPPTSSAQEALASNPVQKGRHRVQGASLRCNAFALQIMRWQTPPGPREFVWLSHYKSLLFMPRGECLILAFRGQRWRILDKSTK